jgi:hypothetical protein
MRVWELFVANSGLEEHHTAALLELRAVEELHTEPEVVRRSAVVVALRTVEEVELHTALVGRRVVEVHHIVAHHIVLAEEYRTAEKVQFRNALEELHIAEVVEHHMLDVVLVEARHTPLAGLRTVVVEDIQVVAGRTAAVVVEEHRKLLVGREVGESLCRGQ